MLWHGRMRHKFRRVLLVRPKMGRQENVFPAGRYAPQYTKRVFRQTANALARCETKTLIVRAGNGC